MRGQNIIEKDIKFQAEKIRCPKWIGNNLRLILWIKELPLKTVLTKMNIKPKISFEKIKYLYYFGF